jgi:hypothetical protein
VSARLGFVLDYSSGDCWRGWRCAAVYPLLNPDPQLAYWGASQRTDEPLVIVLLIGLAMAANYTLLGNALKPVFATTGHQLPFSEPGSSDQRRSVLAAT